MGSGAKRSKIWLMGNEVEEQEMSQSWRLRGRGRHHPFQPGASESSAEDSTGYVEPTLRVMNHSVIKSWR